MLTFREELYTKNFPKNEELVFAADIGGTNSNFGLYSIDRKQQKIQLLYSLHIKSKEIQDFTSVVADVLKHIQNKFNITPTKSCFGVAGVASQESTFAKPTNLPFNVDAQEIKEQTSLMDVVIVNDFVIIGYGLEVIDKKSIQSINQGNHIKFSNKAIIGAGTGFGKTILVWSLEKKFYIPLPSEGGHADFPAQYQQELALVEYIRTKHQTMSVSWEDVLSGQGIQSIYEFLGKTKKYEPTEISKTIEKNILHPDQIFASKNIDVRCNDTVQLFTQFFARCAKDFALNALSLNGLYLAGGIAANNPDIFSRPIFRQEFLSNRKQKSLLEHISVYVITDYNISLYGAARYCMLYF